MEASVTALPDLVDCDAWDMTVQATADLRHLCPFKDEVDDGSVTLAWRVDHKTLELHSLRAYLDGFATVKVSHEDLTRDLFDELSELGLLDVKVTTHWVTAGMSVVASA